MINLVREHRAEAGAVRPGQEARPAAGAAPAKDRARGRVSHQLVNQAILVLERNGPDAERDALAGLPSLSVDFPVIPVKPIPLDHLYEVNQLLQADLSLSGGRQGAMNSAIHTRFPR